MIQFTVLGKSSTSKLFKGALTTFETKGNPNRLTSARLQARYSRIQTPQLSFIGL